MRYMTNPFPRFLLVVSAAILLFGGAAHTRAFKQAVAAIAASNLPAFYASAFKALWLIDSATLVGLGIVFALIAARPVIASGLIVALLALIPAATAVLLYYFIGAFVPAHLLLAAAAMAFFAGLLRTNVWPVRSLHSRQPP